MEWGACILHAGIKCTSGFASKHIREPSRLPVQLLGVVCVSIRWMRADRVMQAS